MKVILLQDVKGQGKKSDVVEVNDNYARNFLIKKGMAEVATPTKINQLKQKQAAADFHKQEEIKSMRALAAEINDKQFTVDVKVGQGGKVFGSVTGQNISDVLNQAGYAVDKKKIILPQAIKSVGEYTVDIKLMEGISAKIKVKVNGVEQ